VIPIAIHTPVEHRDHTEGLALRRMYTNFYFAVRHRHGKRAPGRNIRRHGVKTTHGVRTATSRELARSIRTFRTASPLGSTPRRAPDRGTAADARFYLQQEAASGRNATFRW
jgi:hypothetical protein